MQHLRQLACKSVLDVLSSVDLPSPNTSTLESLSTVKGLFNRVVREDQWDWFSVSGQLGYPSRRISRVISGEINHLRIAIKTQDSPSFRNSRTNLCRLPTRQCLSIFLGRAFLADYPDSGWIYVLSTREIPKLLKIGMTTRTVEERAREISSSTGVVIPFGVRRCWRVSKPQQAESEIHKSLGVYRVRSDREFFQISIGNAAKVIDSIVRDQGFELRTLDNLNERNEAATHTN